MNYAIRSLLLILSVMIALAINSNAQPRYERCLPEEISNDDRVVGSVDLTIVQKLDKLKARCRNGKLVDQRRREIKLLKQECWGNPPADYLEIIQKRNAEIVVLKKKYTVIEVSCKTEVSTL